MKGTCQDDGNFSRTARSTALRRRRRWSHRPSDAARHDAAMMAVVTSISLGDSLLAALNDETAGEEINKLRRRTSWTR